MNIEGAEIDALRGGRNAICKWLPRLAISVYHRASDLWRIPQLVLELIRTTSSIFASTMAASSRRCYMHCLDRERSQQNPAKWVGNDRLFARILG